MQEVSGADLTDLNGSAQTLADHPTTARGPHSFPRISFSLLIQAMARRARMSREYPLGIATGIAGSLAPIQFRLVRPINSSGTAR